jgi:DNA-binding NtrC family response regulator
MKTEILAVCSHPEILQTIVRLINNNPGWNGTGAESEEQAITLFKQQPFHLVLLGSGMDELTEEKLKPVLNEINPAVIFVQHYGGGSGLLTGEIYEALAAANF